MCTLITADLGQTGHSVTTNRPQGSLSVGAGPLQGACVTVLSLQQNHTLSTHSPNLLLLMKHRFSSPLLLPAAPLFDPGQRCLTPRGGLEHGVQNGVKENRQHFRWFHIFHFQVLFVLYRRNTAPNNSCLLISALPVWPLNLYYLTMRRAGEQCLSPHLQAGKRGLSRSLLQSWNCLLLIEIPLQSRFSLKLSKAPAHSYCCHWCKHYLFGNKISRDWSDSTVGHNVHLTARVNYVIIDNHHAIATVFIGVTLLVIVLIFKWCRVHWFILPTVKSSCCPLQNLFC